MKKKRFYLLAFLIPLVIFFIISMIANHIPFGEYIYNYFDSYVQYPTFLTETIRSIKSGSFYTLLGGFGTDFYNIRTLYMNSPLNILFILFKQKNLYIFYTILIYLRIGLASITFDVYLNSRDDNKYSFKKLIFSIIYSLSSFMIVNSQHIMWMDSYILLPLIILGVDKILAGKSAKTYIVFLSLAILINYYIGYMLCIFILLYFLKQSFILKNKNKKIYLNFIISSILSALIGMVVILPAIYTLTQGRAHTFSLASLFGYSKFSLFTIPFNLSPASYLVIDNFLDGSALIYCSLAVVVLNILFYFNKSLSKRERITNLVFTLFFVLSFSVYLIDFSWNLFQEPIWYSHRYAFVFVFFLLTIAYENIEKIDKVNISSKIKIIIIIVFVLLTIGSFSWKFLGQHLPDYYVIYLLIGLITFSLYLLLYNTKTRKLLLCLLLFEVSLNTYEILKTNSFVTLSEAKANLNKKDNYESFEDINKVRLVNLNGNNDDSLLYGYNGVSLFSSIYNYELGEFLTNKLGVFDNTNDINRIDSYSYNPAILSLFGVKYMEGQSDYYKEISYGFYENENVLPLNFTVPKSFKNIELKDLEYFSNIEKIYSVLAKEEVKLFYDINPISQNKNKNEGKIEFKVLHDGLLYINANNNLKYYNGRKNTRKTYNEYEIIINGNKYKKPKDFDNNIKVSKGDIITLEFIFNTKEIDYNMIKVFDNEEFEKIIKKIKEEISSLEMVSSKDVLEGNIAVNEDSLLFLSIPYGKGFKIYVDNKIVSYERLLDSFIGIDLESGKHKVVVKYITPYFKEGLVLSIVGVIVSIIYLCKENKYMLL